eukprot:NODE_550_length_6175_cov_0.398453.p7 type:complete len:117 gc:universal NODE_550_length_6175_cov_0.398453:1687-1337(-)
MPKSFPSHTVKIHLSQNMLTSMPQLPPTLQTFDISYNMIFDKLPNIFPKTLTSFVASHNLIYGDIGNISSTLNLLSLDNNQLNGTLNIMEFIYWKFTSAEFSFLLYGRLFLQFIIG